MTPQPIQLKLSQIQYNIENGIYAIPDFQRDFEWDLETSAKLLDSWIKGYPFGSFILWTTDEELCPIKKIGNITVFDKKDPTEKITYVLDGQQRITSIFAALKGLTIKKKSYEDIVVNLDADFDSHEFDIVTVKTADTQFANISFSELWDFDIVSITQKYINYIPKIQTIRDRILQLDFHAIKIEGANISVATEIFTRLNTCGKELDILDIMVAKTYRSKTQTVEEFHFKNKANELLKIIPKNYSKIGRKPLDAKYILKLVSLCLKKKVTTNAQLSITRDEMINNLKSVVDATHDAVDFCESSLSIPQGKMIAYSAMFELYVYFFYNFRQTHKLAQPSLAQQKNMIDYYWRSVINERFDRSTDSKTEEDVVNVFDRILSLAEPERVRVKLSVEDFIEKGYFDKDSAIIKGLIGLLMSKNPKSLANNSLVNFLASTKSQKNNYHHFFPQNMMGNTWENEPVNNICNIILQDASTNQVEIKNRRPSDYISEFLKINSDLHDTLKGHLINDINEYGILSDNFDTFIKKRASAFIEELKTRLVVIGTDSIDSTIK